MPKSEKSISELVAQLPAASQVQARKYIESLSAKARRHDGHFLKQDWAGALHAFRGQYTSMELQKKALDWRDE